VTRAVLALRLKTFAKSFASAALTVKTDFLVVVAKHSATRSNAHAFSLYANVTLIYVALVEQINTTLQRLLAKTSVFNEDCVSVVTSYLVLS